MKVFVVGRTGSGKTAFTTELKLIAPKLDIFELNNPFELVKYHTTGDRIVLVQSPLLVCLQRSEQKTYNLPDLKRLDEALLYVTEMPNCTIIKNDGSIDDFRVKIKKYLKSI